MHEVRGEECVKIQSDNESVASYSVLISIYHKESSENLRDCLDGILNQTVPADEILIVKDGLLTPELDSVLDEYDRDNPDLFSFVSYSDNRGLWYALRMGVPECRNELIMRMDTDDLSLPERAELQLAYLSEHPEVDCVGSLVTEFEGEVSNAVSLVTLPEMHSEIVRFGKKRCPFRHPTLVYKKSAVLKAGNYQEMPMFEDYDLYMRLAASGCVFYNIQKSLVWMRVGEDFYARRGSVKYLKQMLHFKKTCLKRGDLSFAEFIVSVAPHFVVCLMPNRLRAWVYERFLRSSPLAAESGVAY